MEVTPRRTPTPMTPLRRLLPPNLNPKRRRHTRPLSLRLLFLSSTLPIPLGSSDFSGIGQSSRVRSFPHVEVNYALLVHIPVFIPSVSKKEMGQFLKKVSSFVPGLHVVDIDVPLNLLCREEHKLGKVSLGRKFHISLGRAVPVPIRFHQIDTIVTMLRQKLQLRKPSGLYLMHSSIVKKENQ